MFMVPFCAHPQVITPCRRLILCADNRKEMEDWIAALKTGQSREHFEVQKGETPFTCPALSPLPLCPPHLSIPSHPPASVCF